MPGATARRDALHPGCEPVVHQALSAGRFTARAAAKAPSLAWNRDEALQDMLVRKVFRRLDRWRAVHDASSSRACAVGEAGAAAYRVSVSPRSEIMSTLS